jgi:adenosylcobinamide-phosphate synthase
VTRVPLAITVAVLLAAGLDRAFREPPAEYHPVTLFGRAVDHAANREYPLPKLAGAVLAVALPALVALLVYGALSLVTPFPGVIVAVLAGLVLWSSSSLYLLLDIGGQVIADSEAAPEAAREALVALVGRDTDDLSPAEIRSAAVESLAENLSDGLVAPLSAFALFAFVSVPAAAAAAAFVKAVNTLDSMLGYPGPFGWGSARLDDLVMFVPARVTALLLGVAAGDPEAPFRARRYAVTTPSPNAGWPMGALAAALNVRLEKPDEYVLNEVADLPTVSDGEDALAAIRAAGLAAYAAVALLGVILWL